MWRFLVSLLSTGHLLSADSRLGVQPVLVTFEPVHEMKKTFVINITLICVMLVYIRVLMHFFVPDVLLKIV